MWQADHVWSRQGGDKFNHLIKRRTWRTFWAFLTWHHTRPQSTAPHWHPIWRAPRNPNRVPDWRPHWYSHWYWFWNWYPHWYPVLLSPLSSCCELTPCSKARCPNLKRKTRWRSFYLLKRFLHYIAPWLVFESFMKSVMRPVMWSGSGRSWSWGGLGIVFKIV